MLVNDLLVLRVSLKNRPGSDRDGVESVGQTRACCHLNNAKSPRPWPGHVFPFTYIFCFYQKRFVVCKYEFYTFYCSVSKNCIPLDVTVHGIARLILGLSPGATARTRSADLHTLTSVLSSAHDFFLSKPFSEKCRWSKGKVLSSPFSKELYYLVV